MLPEKEGNNIADKSLTLEIEKFTRDEMDDFWEFAELSTDETAIVMFVTDRDKKFASGEVIALYRDYLHIRTKGKDMAIIHNENMAMDSEFEYETDITASILRNNISSVVLKRPIICNCLSCATKRDRGESLEQPKRYEIEISTASQIYKISTSERDYALLIKCSIRDWVMMRGVFARFNNKKRLLKKGAKHNF